MKIKSIFITENNNKNNENSSWFIYESKENILTLEEIGKFIRYLRKSSKLTQEELSRKVDISRYVVGDFERNAHNIKVHNLVAFLDQFGFELSIIGKNSTLDGNVEATVVRVAEQIYNDCV